MNITENFNWHICSLCASLSEVYYIIISVPSFHMIGTIYHAYLLILKVLKKK